MEFIQAWICTQESKLTTLSETNAFNEYFFSLTRETNINLAEIANSKGKTKKESPNEHTQFFLSKFIWTSSFLQILNNQFVRHHQHLLL